MRVRDVEIIRLRPGRRNLIAEGRLGIFFAAGNEVAVIADADDLHRAIEVGIGEGVDNVRLELDGPRLAIDMRRLAVADKPFLCRIEPSIHLVLLDQRDRLARHVRRQGLLFNDAAVRLH